MKMRILLHGSELFTRPPPSPQGDLKRSCRKKQKLYNRAKKTGKKEHKLQYKEAQKSFQTSLNKAHWNYINNILCTSLEEGNSKPFFKYVRSKREDQVGVPPLKENDVLHTSAQRRNGVRLPQSSSGPSSPMMKKTPSRTYAFMAPLIRQLVT